MSVSVKLHCRIYWHRFLNKNGCLHRIGMGIGGAIIFIIKRWSVIGGIITLFLGMCVVSALFT